MTNIDSALSAVRRPARYIGGEWNSASARGKNPSARICFCFPDLYEIGMSSPGMEIIYSVVNESPEFAAERCYAPDADMFNALKKNSTPLFSLETKSPLASFDVVGFTLQYELCATNVLYMLEAAGIPFLSSERKDVFPLLIAGGPVTLNPEPFADIFDAFVIGDAEEAIIEVMKTVASARAASAAKTETLRALAAIKGVYVPAFYEPEFVDGVFSRLEKTDTAAGDCVEKRIFDIRRRAPEIRPVVPTSSSVNARLVTEIARGCPHNCRFCQARRYYWPWRIRDPGVIKESVRLALRNTGYDEVSFASLSSGDYPGIADLIESVMAQNTAYPLAVALPSLHCARFDDRLASALERSASRPSLTFAPEAGTPRLRASVGKNFSDDDIVAAVLLARRRGWKQVKLYFMCGLPGETDEDLNAISALVKRLRVECRGIGIKAAVSPFVPKPHTAFEREKFAGVEELKRKIGHLRRALGDTAKSHDVESSFVECLVARGDRRLSKVFLRAYQKGCRFDQWRENFDFAAWSSAFAEEGIVPEEYVNRLSDGAALPWAHIIPAPAGFSASPPSAEVAQVAAPSVSCAAPASSRQQPAFLPKESASRLKQIKFRVRLARKNLARFVSHNDQIEMLRRSVRRAQLPVKYSEGFHPQPKIAFGPAVSVGHESNAEYMEMEFARYLPPQEIAERLTARLPDGYSVLSAGQIPGAFPSFETLCGAVEYTVHPAPECRPFDAPLLEKFLAAESAMMETDGKSVDARKTVRSAVFDGAAVKFTLNIVPGKGVKPEKLAAFIFGVDASSARVLREKFFAVRKDGTIFEI